MRRRKRPYTGRGKGVFGQILVKNCCYYTHQVFTFHSSGSDRYNCIHSRQNSSFAVVCDILKRRCERYENQWWTGDVVLQHANMSLHGSNCCTTWLLRNKIQTCFKIVQLLHNQSNHTTRDQTVCSTACVVQNVRKCIGPLRRCDTASPGTTRSTTQSRFSDNSNLQLCRCEKLQNSRKCNYNFWKLWASTSLIMNLRVGDFLTSCESVSFSRKNLLHGVSKLEIYIAETVNHRILKRRFDSLRVWKVQSI